MSDTVRADTVEGSTSRRKFAEGIASVGRLAAGHSDGYFQYPDTMSVFTPQRAGTVAPPDGG